MNDLIAWLRACLDDDEKAAKAALQYDPAPWEASTSDSRPTNAERNGEDVPPDSGWVINARKENLWDDEGCLAMGAAAAHHIARHDPAAVLADVAAKRAVLDRYAATLTETPADLGGSNTRMAELLIEETRDTLEMVVRTLALAYRHRPGWQEEWEA